MLEGMRAGLIALALALAAAPSAAAQTQEMSRADIVVELYTSQGCWQCPRANRLLGQFTAEPGVLALTFAVGYWDYLGWPDTFAQPDFTDRQTAFSRALRERGLSTPQLVFSGLRQSGASDWDEAHAVLAEVRALTLPDGVPEVSIRRLPSGAVRATLGAGDTAGRAVDVWMLGFDPGPVTIFATRGANAQRRIVHYNLVRTIDRAGFWSGEPSFFERQICRPQCAVLVQEPNGGRIIAAAYTRPAAN